MNILTQTNNILNNQVLNIDHSISKLMIPHITSLSSLDYATLIQDIDLWMRNFIKTAFVAAIEKADQEFRNSPSRIQRYYVKQTRSRSLITVFGEITFKRTEYIHRDTKKPFCYIDRKLAIKPRQRYDCCVEAKVKELYANHNSMIKVGEEIGKSIYSSFSLNPIRKLHSLSRQTVYNLLHRTGKITIDPTPMKDTPETLYIMADEKYVSVQGEEKIENKRNKEMIKVAVCFEDRNPIYTKDKSKIIRYALKNKLVISSCASEDISFWDNVLEQISKRYDLNKIKNIYILGDGAKWIKNGASVLRMPGISVKYALDRFHATQAINKMTTDETFRELLRHYLYSLNKDEFKTVSKIVGSYIDNIKQKERFNQQLEYLLNNWNAFRIMCKEVKIGCAMEQAISHIIASVFTSVPKAYSRKNLPLYLSTRILHTNNEDILKLHLLATDLQKEECETIHFQENHDYSFFDNQIREDTYKVHIRNRSNKKQEFRF